MRSPLYYKKHKCGQIMSSHRRRDTEWTRTPDLYYYDKRMYHSQSVFYIEHTCPACDTYEREPTDSEWRSEGKELDLGTYGGIE